MKSNDERAQDQELFFYTQLQERFATSKVVKPGPEECVDCGAEMPEVRRNHGFELCIDCAMQREHEAKKRR